MNALPEEPQAKLPSDLAQHITFEGCDYVLMSPEDYDAQADEVRRLREALEGNLEPLTSAQIELLRQKSFVQGAAYALATINRNHDQPTMVAEVLIALGVTTAVELGKNGVELYDIDGLRDALEYMRRRGIATKRQRAALTPRGSRT